MKADELESKPGELFSTNVPLSTIQFSDIFDLDEMQRLQDLFSNANGVASVITTADGEPITEPSNFTRLCNIIRKTEIGRDKCYKSDVMIGKQNSFSPTVQPCLGCGLWDAGASITVGGKHIANWLIGQIINDHTDEQRMLQYADEIGVNRTDLLEALHEVPVMSVEKFNSIAKLLFSFVKELSENAYRNLCLKKEIAEGEKTNELLKESEERFQLLFNKAPLSYQSLDIASHFIEVNQHWLDTFGYTYEEVIGKWFGDFLSPKSRKAFLTRFPIFIAKGKDHSQYEMIHKNGNLLSIVFDGEIGHDLNGKFLQTHGILQDITELKLAEKKLKESEFKYRKLIENSPDAIVIYVKDKIVFVNNECVHLIAAAGPDELIGKSIFELIHPDCRELIIGRMKELTNEGVIVPLVEVKFVRLDGSVIDGEVKSMSIRFDNKLAVLVIARDITARKQAEYELQRKNTLLKLTGETANVGGWEFDTETMMQNWTEEVYHIHEIDFTFKPNVQNGISFYSPSSRPVIEVAIQRAIEYGEPFDLELEIITNKGNHRWVHSIGKPYRENGKTKKVYGSIQDITKLKLTEQALRESEDRLKLALETSHTGAWSHNLLDNTSEHSLAYDHIFGYKTKLPYWTYETFLEHVLPEDRQNVDRRYREAIATQLDWSHDFRIRRVDGEVRWVFAACGHILNSEGKSVRLSGLLQDITERKMAELEIQSKNEELLKVNAEKDKFFSIIAHDLRSPLSGFMGITELMIDKSMEISREELYEMAVVMRKSASNIFRLLGNLLEWSRLQRGLTSFTPELILLSSIISDSLNQIIEDANKKDIIIVFEIPEDLSLWADKNMLESIIRNLVSNAVKFTPKGGRVTVSAKSDSGKLVEISIRDTGIGISKQMIPNLFLLDSKTNRKGTEGEYSTGLGLIICKDFVEKHGGELLIESEEGRGSLFSFTIPCIRETNEIKVVKSIAVDEKAMQQSNPKTSGLKILIAEDDEVSEILISNAVQKISKEIIKVKTGIDAVEVCCNNPDIDIVLMDIQMPEMDGYEATRQIRLFNKKVVIIAETAYALKSDREMALTAGCNDYISKPYGRFKLISVMKKHLRNNIIA